MKVLSGLMFFPRGGSAHVARALAGELEGLGHEVTVLTGSLDGSAESFYAGLDVHPVDFARGDAPMHPSYEDRPGAPDVCFATVDDDGYARHLAAWCDALAAAGASDCDVLHLHHLTPLHEAARRVAPGVPVVGHLHGTELLMLEAIADGRAGGGRVWGHAHAWRRRMRRWAQGCDQLVLLAESQRRRAVDLLGVDPDRCTVVPNGVDLDRFAPAEGRVPDDDRPVLLTAGRFTAVKRMPLLIAAFERARRELAARGVRPRLVVVGGHGDEHEGEHPREAIARVGARDVELAGWMDHDGLADALRAADVFALASVREQFGLVLVEAMACGLPCVAVDAYGPQEVVEPAHTGWLVAPDDEDELTGALIEALGSGAERRRRGRHARAAAEERFGWPAVAAQLEAVLEAATPQVV